MSIPPCQQHQHFFFTISSALLTKKVTQDVTATQCGIEVPANPQLVLRGAVAPVEEPSYRQPPVPWSFEQLGVATSLCTNHSSLTLLSTWSCDPAESASVAVRSLRWFTNMAWRHSLLFCQNLPDVLSRYSRRDWYLVGLAVLRHSYFSLWVARRTPRTAKYSCLCGWFVLFLVPCVDQKSRTKPPNHSVCPAAPRNFSLLSSSLLQTAMWLSAPLLCPCSLPVTSLVPRDTFTSYSLPALNRNVRACHLNCWTVSAR